MENLQEILEQHKEWLKDNTKGKRANLRYANLRYANLSDVDLRYADLFYANLRYANLSDANLRYADLCYANLSDANLRYADLCYANLRYANLRYANLSDADLRHCIGNNNEIKSLQIGTYLISYTKDILNIGCQSHPLNKWKSFTDKEIEAMDSDALYWWKLNKDIIITLVERETNA